MITDRVVLDRQLQETIYQFEHARGVVSRSTRTRRSSPRRWPASRPGSSSPRFRSSRSCWKDRRALPSRRYAVIVDEAHSSQTGEAAKDLRLVLGATEEQELTAAEAEDAGFVTEAIDPVEEALAKAVARPRAAGQPLVLRLHRHAEGRTLELFGTSNPATGKYEPFHLYSMRQAIEEGFILDVLAVLHDLQDLLADREGRQRTTRLRGAEGPAGHRPVRVRCTRPTSPRRPRSSSSTSAPTPRTKIGGKAKAMVVTSSRLHAVRYKQAIDAYIAKKGYTDLRTLVAFSGRVIDDKGTDLHRAGHERLPESRDRGALRHRATTRC